MCNLKFKYWTDSKILVSGWMSDLVLTATSFDKNKKNIQILLSSGPSKVHRQTESLEDKAVNDALPPLPVAQRAEIAKNVHKPPLQSLHCCVKWL